VPDVTQKTFFMNRKQTRVVKLQGKYRQLSGHWNGGNVIPWLNVSGVWLEQAGFKAGDQVEITVTSNQLIIKNLLCDGATRD
jgi:toxic protein SymE